MNKYVSRLINCGYTGIQAYDTCKQFIKDFSLFELENFIQWVENVDRV